MGWSEFVNALCLNLLFAPVREYCESESFKAKCWVNEVIMMQSAFYGRMNIGKCVEADLGYLGCKADVLELADRRCSGRRECEIDVPNAEFDETKPCYKELKVYLEASYTCVKVLNAQKHHCHAAVKIPVTTDEGHIASQTTFDTDCGTQKSPWILEAQPGQKLNLSLVDFSWKPSSTSSLQRHKRCSSYYGYVYDRESTVNTSLCGGSGERFSHLLESSSHTLQVVLSDDVRKNIKHFLIQFAAVGCPNLLAPKHAWLKRDGDEAIVGCDETRQTWHLKCNGRQWIGVIGNCTQHLVAARTDAVRAQAAINMPHGVAIFVIVAVAILISCIIIVIGMACLKRYKKDICKSAKNQVKYNGIKTYEDKMKQTHVHTITHSPQHVTHDVSTGQYMGRNDYTATQHIWEYPLPDPTSNNNQHKDYTSTSNTTSGYSSSQHMGGCHTPASGDDAYHQPVDSTYEPSRSNRESGRYYVLDRDAMTDAENHQLN